ncbi:hypothetical protein BpHYR1_031640 [Brachionus plicatilis]|uniref:Uncharacterized protein n=1 Tax=Brachionus plicatilis TaxID=10195 RepID=A0A3M7S4J1_BRAPC|nr:hypothetical protein BpHYR1_031640 [Brachionus plicatilis]
MRRLFSLISKTGLALDSINSIFLHIQVVKWIYDQNSSNKRDFFYEPLSKIKSHFFFKFFIDAKIGTNTEMVVLFRKKLKSVRARTKEMFF